MFHKFFRLVISLFLALAMTAIASGPRLTRAAGPWYVSTTGNDANNCLSPATTCATINGAIDKATNGDTINVAIGTYTGSGTEVVLIDKDITLSGGWDTSFSTQDGMSTIDGEGSRRGISLIDSNVTSIVERVMVQNGNYSWGGGIANYGNLTLNNSSISGNTSSFIEGGGIANYGTFTLNNSTISDNKGGGWGGGGIYTITGGNVTVNNSTIIGNSGIFGGGIYITGGTLTLTNTIISDNTASSPSDGPNCYSVFATLASNGHNIISDTSGCDVTATTGDQFNVDPQLGMFLPALGYSALLPTSPAIDAGDPTTCLPTDQRGVTRPQGPACDIGAFELEAETEGIQVSIDIKPGNRFNTINLNHDLFLPVAILSTAQFNAPQQVDRNSLTFGATGNENSLTRTGHKHLPNCQVNDVNKDGYSDLVCKFELNKTGFQPGDTKGILKGSTINNLNIEGSDSVIIKLDH